MSQLVKRGKLLLDINYPSHLQNSFTLHRDLKSCLSLRQATEVFNKHQHELTEIDRTPFLEYLNNYPLSYHYRYLDSPIKIYLQILSMQNLSIYEQQLKLAILVRLKEYLCKDDKYFISEEIRKQEDVIVKGVKEKAYDTVHALNLLFLHKDATDNQLYRHCVEVLKGSQYQILEAIMPKIAPLITKSKV
jgi:hypothetical protein